MTRKEAIQKKLRKYFTGRNCSKGHNSPRYTNSGACVACIAGYFKKYETVRKLRRVGIIKLGFEVDPADVMVISDFVRQVNERRALDGKVIKY